MNVEIQRFREAAARVVALLTGNEKLTPDEEETIAAEVGRVRSELGLWRNAGQTETLPNTEVL